MKTICLLLVFLIPGSVLAEGVLTPAANPTAGWFTVSGSAISFLKASSGSVGNNCAITGMTALPRTISGGAYIYLPLNAIAAGSAAGWYWFVASSTTAGTCYNSTYSSGTPTRGTATAFSTTGPGAFTGATGAVTSVSIPIPANSLGRNGRLRATYGFSATSSGSNKIVASVFGSTTLLSTTTASGTSAMAQSYIMNRDATNVQSTGGMASTTASGLGIANPTDGAEDTTAVKSVTFTLNAALATDNIILENYLIEILTR